MGVADSRKPLPLPAPTETDSNTPSELTTDVSRLVDDKSIYSLPEDGTPVTIKTRHKANRSQTSLLIEYFEGSKGASGSGSDRKPSVRVRLTPSKNRRSDHIQITETKSTRKASLSRRSAPNTPSGSKIEGEGFSVLSGEGEDGHSMTSYASATEESNVSRNPIDIEIDHRRRRRPASPLIPTAMSSKVSCPPGAMSEIPGTTSEISAIPTDSFLDGSGPSSRSPGKRRDSAGDLVVGAAEKLRGKTRGEERERAVLPKARDRERSDRKSKSKSRTSSVSENGGDKEEAKSSRRRSSRTHQDSAVSAADSSVLSSALSPSHLSHDQYSVRSGASKTSSINNPKLLETVEDAIRRLILPELNALKREQSKHRDRRSSVASSGTSVSKEEHGTDRRRSGGSERHALSRESTSKLKEARDREARNNLNESPVQNASHESVGEYGHDEATDDTPHRSGDMLKAAAAGAALGGLAAAALGDRSPALAREQRKRRRAEAKHRAVEQYPDEYDGESEYHQITPPMPLSSEVNPSELTRTSILSADSERPHSASEELTPAPQAGRRSQSRESSPTPTKDQPTVHPLGLQHSNVSHGDLRALPRTNTGGSRVEQNQTTEDYDRKYPEAPGSPADEYDDYDEQESGMQYQYGGDQPGFDYYNTQEVPAPLNYVPYQQQRRGLSPIPSVSGYTEGGSEVQQNRDSALTHATSGSLSSPAKSRHDNMARSPSPVRSNIVSREFDQDDRSLMSSAVGAEYRNTNFTDESEVDHVTTEQAVRGVGANPNFVHIPMGVESAVASLVDGSMLDESVLTAESGGHSGYQYGNRGSMATLEEEACHGSHRGSDVHLSLRQRSSANLAKEASVAVPPSPDATNSTRSRASRGRDHSAPSPFAGEYDLDQYGRKVPRVAEHDRHSPTASETAITGAAVAAATAAMRRAVQEKGMQPQVDREVEYEGFPEGVQRNKSFKQRTMDGHPPANTPSHSVDRLVGDYELPKMGASGVPDANDPMPEYGYYEEMSTPSVVDGQLGDAQDDRVDLWSGQRTPVQFERQELSKGVDGGIQRGGHGTGTAVAVPAAAAAAAGAALASTHGGKASQDHEEDWQRTSDERKRDTLVTNPFEGTSPNVNIPGLGGDLLVSAPVPVFQNGNFPQEYTTRSPLGHKIDEGYISQGANKTPDITRSKGKGVEFSQQTNIANLEDPFYTPKAARHMSGLSHGMGSPLYDAATGAGIDNIESKDIIALMQHLMVRDAQRSARDTEILMTLVRTAAEFRDAFEKMKVMMAESEDVIIKEIGDNTDRSIQRAIGGPRPFPGSSAKSFLGESQTGTEDLPTKKQNLFRRALKGLSAKGNSDLGRIEEMLMQLLSDVDNLKAQTIGRGGLGAGLPASPVAASPSHHLGGNSFENLQPAVQYEHDRGYEPEGNAGTSTASHASQSGHLSIPQSRGPSTKLGYERKFSDHRISTVPEANEDEYDHDHSRDHGQHQDPALAHYSNPDMLSVPHDRGVQRGSSAPLATPPQQTVPAQASLSNENTPRTDKSKKHKSSSSSSWFPKISRWSETTTSSVGKVFRSSRDSKKDNDGGEFNGPSRSGSDLGEYEDSPRMDPYGDDKHHTGFPAQDLVYMTPEDPKYKAHRDSLNLQHPQPRSGQPFKVALESRAEDFDSPRSPRSADWAGSATSLHRFHGQGQRDPQQYWASSSPGPGAGEGTSGPPRPPKEPINNAASQSGHLTPPKTNRVSKLQKSSPLPYHSVESGYGTATHASYNGSPRLENRNLSGALSSGVPTRRPSGPRAMTPKSTGSVDEDGERRRKRDTFGTMTSQESETF